jgi:hypothetical protein
MEQHSGDAAAKVFAFANGLQKNLAVSGRRWKQWPRGADNLVTVLACIDGVRQRLGQSASAHDDAATIAAAVADLRAILEWTTYQATGIATARALLVARKTRAYAERFGVLDNPAARLSILIDSEASLIENVRTKNEYMSVIAERHAHLGLPQPLVMPESLAPKSEKPTGKLDLIQQLMKSAKRRR